MGACKEENRALVVRLYCNRVSVREISSMVGLTQATVKRIVNELKEMWRAEFRETAEDMFLRELAELDEMERQSVEEFERTRNPIWFTKRIEIKKRRAAMIGTDASDRRLGAGRDDHGPIEVKLSWGGGPEVVPKRAEIVGASNVIDIEANHG